jgi:hypothetical protein
MAQMDGETFMIGIVLLPLLHKIVKMIKLIRKFADWLEDKKCRFHFGWNRFLENLKTNCSCERSGR